MWACVVSGRSRSSRTIHGQVVRGGGEEEQAEARPCQGQRSWDSGGGCRCISRAACRCAYSKTNRPIIMCVQHLRGRTSTLVGVIVGICFFHNHLARPLWLYAAAPITSSSNISIGESCSQAQKKHTDVLEDMKKRRLYVKGCGKGATIDAGKHFFDKKKNLSDEAA